MSHNVTVSSIKIPNLSVINRAIKELQREGAKISINAEPGKFSSYGRQMHPCERAITITGESTYQIGVVKNSNVKEGGFVFSYDQSVCQHNPLFVENIGVTPQAVGIDGKKASERGRYDTPNRAVGRLVQRCNLIAAEDRAAEEGREFTRTFDTKTRQFVLEVAA